MPQPDEGVCFLLAKLDVTLLRGVTSDRYTDFTPPIKNPQQF